MKTLKRKIAIMLTLCMVLTGINPAYADEVKAPEAASDAITNEADEIFEITEIIEEASPAEAEYDQATPSDAEYTAAENNEKNPEEDTFKRATPSNAKKNAEVLIRETTVDGIKITLTADPEVFPEDAELWAEKVEDEATEEAIEEAVEKERDSSVNVASSYKFDIKMFVNGEEVQPDTEKGSVKVSFTLEEKISDCLSANAYHLKEETDGELTAEEVLSDVIIESDAAADAKVTEIKTEVTGFSYYVVEFTYNELQYVLPGDSSVKLSEILKTLTIEGTVSEAEVSNEELFTVTKDAEADDWTVTALQAFDTKEWMKVTIGSRVYEIVVTDAAESAIGVTKFAWGAIKYSAGIKTMKLSYLLTGLKITLGRIEEAESDNEQLFTVVKDTPEKYADWTLTIQTQSDTPGKLTARVDGVRYEISVTVSGVKRETVSYTDTDGINKTNKEADCIIMESCDDYEFLPGEWYAVKGDITIPHRIKNLGTADNPAHLILCDTAKLTARGGINSNGGLEIYGQQGNAGDLVIDSVANYCAGIGGGQAESGGSIVIKGGRLNVTAGIFAAGIGGGMNGGLGSIAIYGGTINAAGGGAAAGIGAGISNTVGGSIVIKGGTIKANGGGSKGPAIGSGQGSETQGDLEIDDVTLEIHVGDKIKTCAAYARDRDTSVEIIYGAPYTVYHYFQNVERTGYDKPVRELKYGHHGTLTRAVPRGDTGFKPAQVITQYPIADDGSTTVDIKYDRIQGVIIFDANGHGTAPRRITAYYGQKVEEPEAPTAVGFVFSGWYLDKECTRPYTFSTIQGVQTILFAKWEKSLKKYNISWMLTETSKPFDTTVVYEGEIPSHEGPVLEDRVFMGWDPKPAPATQNARYVAMFELRGTKQAVSFNTNGGTFVYTQLVEHDERAKRPADPEKEGYIFAGWYREAAFVTRYDFNDPVNTDITLYARWADVPSIAYTVTWKLDEDTVIDTEMVLAGSMPAHSSPSKPGYIFIGWNPDLELVMSDITYTAKFEQRTPDKAAVAFNTDGGSFVETQVVLKGKTAVRPANPTKSGYRFVNWYADKAFGTLYDFSKAVTADITLYAKWEKNAGKEYTITWKDWNGAVLATSKVAENGLPKYPGTAKPVRSGHAFTGWTPEIDLATADKTYTAAYVSTSTGGGGGGGGGGTVSTTVKATPTFSPNWYSDELGVWRIRSSAGQTVTDAWLCDDVVKANGKNVWYLLRQDGAMVAAGLVQDNTGNFYSLETEHNGYFGMLRYENGTYNCNGQQVYLTFNHEHNGSFGAITNAEGLEKLKQIYGVTQYGIGNENSVYTASF